MTGQCICHGGLLLRQPPTSRTVRVPLVGWSEQHSHHIIPGAGLSLRLQSHNLHPSLTPLAHTGNNFYSIATNLTHLIETIIYNVV